jgi:orotate phosphoribosyltransferase-like protein
MSRIKDLIYDIQELFIDGMSAKTIAKTLDVPLEQVLITLESFGVDETQQEELSPYETINS